MKLIKCDCGDLSHILEIEKDDVFVFLRFLCTPLNLWERLIACYRILVHGNTGDFIQEIVLNKREVKQLREEIDS